jgi:hypothetical protein
VRYRDRNLLAGEESLGIVEPLLMINERITERRSRRSSRLLPGVQAAVRPRLGAEDRAGRAQGRRARSGTSTRTRPTSRSTSSTAAKVDLEIRNAAIRDFAAIGQIPAQALGIDGISNISDATLAGLEAAKNREAGEITTSLGESHEQLLRLCAYIDGNSPPPTTTPPRSAGATSRPAPTPRRSTAWSSWSQGSA